MRFVTFSPPKSMQMDLFPGFDLTIAQRTRCTLPHAVSMSAASSFSNSFSCKNGNPSRSLRISWIKQQTAS